MKNFVIGTETTSDLTKEFLKKEEIAIINVPYTLDGEECDPDTFDVNSYYKEIRNGRDGKTSQPSASEMDAYLDGILSEGRDLLQLSFSSALSGIYTNMDAAAKRIAEKYPERKVYVVDSRAACGGQGLFVYLVNEYAKTGKTIEETYQYALDTVQRVNHFFTVDDLKYLVRGGRCKPSSAFFGNILQIKPVLHVDTEGRLTPFVKVLSRKPSINMLASKMFERYDGMSKKVYIMHADCLDDAEYLKSKILSQLPDLDVEVLPLGPVIGAHSGPGTVALFFTGKDKVI